MLIGTDPLQTEHPKILKVQDSYVELKELEKKLKKLNFLIEHREVKKIVSFFNELSDEFKLETKDLDLNLVKKNFN